MLKKPSTYKFSNLNDEDEDADFFNESEGSDLDSENDNFEDGHGNISGDEVPVDDDDEDDGEMEEEEEEFVSQDEEDDMDEDDDEDEEELISKFMSGDIELPGGDDKYDEFYDPMEKGRNNETMDEMERKIEALEDMMQSEKPWHLRGEVKATDRDEDALLEEILEFDSSKLEKPMMSEDVEEIIRKRVTHDIKNGTFDDVERRKKPAPEREEFRRKVVVNSEKPKSLSQVYEEEFKMSQMTQKLEDPKREKLRRDMLELFAQLDALCNSKFVPRMPNLSGNLVKPTAAITLEETIPTAVSSSQLMTPKDVIGHQKQPLGSEITKTDRNRFLKKKKKRKGIVLKEQRTREDGSQTESMRKVLRMSHKPQSNIIISDKIATMWGNKVKRAMKPHGGRKKRKNINKTKVLE